MKLLLSSLKSDSFFLVYKNMSKENINGKIFCAYELEDLMLLGYQVLPKMIDRFNVILSKFQWRLFAEIEKSILQFTWNLKGPQIAKQLKEENKVRDLTLPDFKT